VPTNSWADRFAATPYVQRLGAELASVAEDRVELLLPFREANTNPPGKALHGGVNASLIVCAGALAAELGLDPGVEYESGVVDLSVVYLAAAVGEDVRAEGRVLRRGREIVFAEGRVTSSAGRLLAQGLVTHRAVPREVAERAAREDPVPERIDPAAFVTVPYEPGPMGRSLGRAPFMGSILSIDHMVGGRAVLSMEAKPELLDGAGSHHPGALAALLDSAGAMASWSLVPLGLHKAMTPGIQIAYVAPSHGERVLALARNLGKHAETFSNRVELVGAASGRLIAHGLLTYRIVVGERLPS
jgi:uncharacterized protein (TIGR00369 family)